jgi:hypothetical protein
MTCRITKGEYGGEARLGMNVSWLLNGEPYENARQVAGPQVSKP